jgi:hypothetical protein
MHTLQLTDGELGRLRLLLDSEYRRILREAPECLDDPATYAATIAQIRSQLIYLQDRKIARERQG